MFQRNGGDPSAWFTVRLLVKSVMVKTFPLCAVRCESNAPPFIILSLCFFLPLPLLSLDKCKLGKWPVYFMSASHCTLEGRETRCCRRLLLCVKEKENAHCRHVACMWRNWLFWCKRAIQLKWHFVPVILLLSGIGGYILDSLVNETQRSSSMKQ